MKKFIIGLIILCLIIVAGVGYIGSRNGSVVPQGAVSADSPAGTAGTDSGAAAAPVDGPDGITVGGADTGAAAAEYSMPSVYLDYETLYGLHGADEKAYRIGEKEGTWGDYFYLLYTQSSQIEQYLATYAMYGMPVSWEDKVEEDGEETFADYATETARKLTVQLTALEIFAEQNGVELDDGLLVKLEEQKQADILNALGEGGTEEEFYSHLEEIYLSREMYDRITLQNLLYQESFKKIYGENGENVTDEDAIAWLESNQYMSAVHILFLNKDSETGEALDEAAVAAKKAELEALLEELRAIEDPEARAEAFKEKMNELSEDPGKESYPDGYTFKPGAMVAEFENAVLTMEDYEISDVVETSYGYHIVMRLPLDPDRVVEFNSSTGDPRTARMLAANQEYGDRLQELADGLSFEWLPGFEDPILTDYLKD